MEQQESSAEEEAGQGRWVTTGHTLAGVSLLMLAVMYLVTWISREALGRNMIRYLVYLLLLEFIIIHSSAFLGLITFTKARFRDKLKAFMPIAGFYSVFAAIFAYVYGSPWPLIVFWGLQANRLVAAYRGRVPTDEQKLRIRGVWAMSAVVYLALAFMTTLLPVPKFGVTEALEDISGESGLWFDEPWRPMAFGFVYFLLLGLAEIYFKPSRKKPKPRNGSS
jgi:hypothetical protein